MLVSLHIKNVVLIEQLNLSFATGLSALTGETGAGKSILLDSLGLALGARAESSLVRRGADQASVSAHFELPPNHPAHIFLNEQGIVGASDITLRRTLGVDGRSKAYINDEPISITLLKTLGESLVDIHGQFETYGLLNPATHQSVLDQYARTDKELQAVGNAYKAWRDACGQLDSAKALAEKAAAQEEFLRSAVDELDKLDPQDDEETSLLEKRKRVQNREAILEALNFALEALGGEGGADIMLAQVEKKLIRQSEKIGDAVDAIQETLNRASLEIGEACRQIEDIARLHGSDDMNAEAIDDRLYALRGAARKYQITPNVLPKFRQDCNDQLRVINHQDHILGDLQKIKTKAEADYRLAAETLHQKRVAAAVHLDKAVQTELKPLKLDKATFMSDITAKTESVSWGPNGYDHIQFLVATNAGTSAGPLHKIASGGEMARFMLALKVVLAEKVTVKSVYVFDEIDTGIGGATADAVGERLARLATQHQVMVVTHSPQVAARAAHHWAVTKAGGGTQVISLGADEKREEIARMLAGSEITVEARAAAARLLENSFSIPAKAGIHE